MEQQNEPELAEIFSDIYANDTWSGGSGPGSQLESIQPYLQYLQRFIDSRGIKTIVDVGCGDWQTTRTLDLSRVSYLGLDIVPSVIEANRTAYGTDNIEFRCTDLSNADLPEADLLICKDVLQHLPNSAGFNLLAQLPKFKYALLTNDFGSNDDRDATVKSNPWHFARMDLTQMPFGLPGHEVMQFLDDKRTLLLERPEPLPEPAPRVLIAILAKQKEEVLRFYLDCIEALDYPKSSISLYVRTNNNTDRTAEILREWVERVSPQYEHVEFDDTDVTEQVQEFGIHEWNAVRFKVLAAIRQTSLQRALDRDCDFYFTADVDNFVRPSTLRELVRLDLPIVAPLLRHIDPHNPYSNYHTLVDANGYYLDCPEYYSVLNQKIRGVTEVKVAHCTYLLRKSALPYLTYSDGSDRFEYVIFADSARRNGIPQYLDNRQIYGYLSLDLAEGAREDESAARRMLGPEVSAALKSAR